MLCLQSPSAGTEYGTCIRFCSTPTSSTQHASHIHLQGASPYKPTLSAGMWWVFTYVASRPSCRCPSTAHPPIHPAHINPAQVQAQARTAGSAQAQPLISAPGGDHLSVLAITCKCRRVPDEQFHRTWQWTIKHYCANRCKEPASVLGQRTSIGRLPYLHMSVMQKQLDVSGYRASQGRDML
jgi:hypothetical protein